VCLPLNKNNMNRILPQRSLLKSKAHPSSHFNIVFVSLSLTRLPLKILSSFLNIVLVSLLTIIVVDSIVSLGLSCDVVVLRFLMWWGSIKESFRLLTVP
jgi:hypothetical protein